MERANTPESVDPAREGAWCLALATPTLPPATTTNTLVIGGDRLVVIEPASAAAHERARLDALLDRLGAEGRRVVAVCATHHHVDHVGDLRRLADRHGAPLIAHADTAARLPFAVDEEIAPAAVDTWAIELGDGRRLHAIATPGHARGHLCFWEPASGLVYGGDLVASEGTILVDPDDGGDMAVYLDSLQRMIEHFRAAPGVLVPAHGDRIAEPVAVLERYVAHRRGREQRVVDALAGGARDFGELLACVYADTPGAPPALAAMSLEAHLRKLEGEGRLERRAGPLRRPARGRPVDG